MPQKLKNHDLLERLTEVFREHGYEGASLARISKATGLEKASLYHRFPRGKEQMAVAVLEHVGSVFTGDVLAPLGGSGPLEERLAETARRIDAFYRQGEGSCVLDTLSLRDGGEELHRTVRNVYLAWRDAFAAASVQAGLDSAQAQQQAERAIMRIHGALVLARATGDAAQFQQAIRELPRMLAPQAARHA